MLYIIMLITTIKTQNTIICSRRKILLNTSFVGTTIIIYMDYFCVISLPYTHNMKINKLSIFLYIFIFYFYFYQLVSADC